MSPIYAIIYTKFWYNFSYSRTKISHIWEFINISSKLNTFIWIVVKSLWGGKCPGEQKKTDACLGGNMTISLGIMPISPTSSISSIGLISGVLHKYILERVFTLQEVSLKNHLKHQCFSTWDSDPVRHLLTCRGTTSREYSCHSFPSPSSSRHEPKVIRVINTTPNARDGWGRGKLRSNPQPS